MVFERRVARTMPAASNSILLFEGSGDEVEVSIFRVLTELVCSSDRRGDEGHGFSRSPYATAWQTRDGNTAFDFLTLGLKVSGRNRGTGALLFGKTEVPGVLSLEDRKVAN